MIQFRWLQIVLAALLLSLASACGDGDDSGNNSTTPCEVDADCSGNQICSPEDVCVDRGPACETVFDCGFNEYCTGEYCRPAACQTSDDCEGDFICDEGTSTCQLGCEADSDCSGTQVCSPLTNRCEEPGCTANDCGTYEVCDDNFDPPECRLDGSCDPEVNPRQTCGDYTAQVGDGIERFCDETTSRCEEVPPCESDDDCEFVGEICFVDPDGRNVCEEGCRANDDCGLGEVCGADNKCVAGCSSDEACAAAEGDGFVCRDQICVLSCSRRDDCVALGPDSSVDNGYVCLQQICQRCTADDECFGSEVCDLTADEEAIDGEEPVDDDGFGLCQDAPDPCPDDAYGDNHAQEDPFVIQGDLFEAVGDASANFCRRNQAGEWFSISADDGKVIEITIEYAGDGNLDVALLQSDGAELVASARPGREELPDRGVEKLVWGVKSSSGPQNFLVHVRGTVFDPKTEYEMTIEVRDPVPCADDGFEPNNAREDAVELPGNNTAHRDLEACGDDPDFYRLPVLANQVVTIGVEAPVRLGELDLFLLGPDGTTLATATDASNSAEIVYNSSVAQDLVLEVQVANGVGRVLYDVAWEQEPNVCLDQYDPNQTCADAPVFTEGQYPSLSVCDNDADFYAVDLDPLDQLRVVVEYDRAQAQGELQLNLFGPNNVCASLLAADEESVPNSSVQRLVIQGENGQTHWPTAIGGRYYVRAGLFSGVQADYSVEIDVIDGPDCVDDAFDSGGVDNDSTQTAVALTRGDVFNNGPDSALLDLKVCDQNEDWYQIALEPGDTLEWVVNHDAQVDLEAFLYDSDGITVLDSATASTASDTVTTTVPMSATAPKTVYLKVNAKFTARADYTVLTYVNGDGPADPQCPDSFENNDDSAEAKVLVAGTYQDLLSCSGDSDWYATELEAGETIDVSVGFNTSNGDVNIFLYADDTTTEVDRATTRVSPEEVSYTTSRSQTVYYRVDASGTQARVPYSVDVSVTAAAPCAEDRFSGNSDAATAEVVTAPGLYSQLNKCENTSDWFAVELTQDQLFEAFIRHDASLADLDLRILEEDPANLGTYTVLETGSSTTDDESVTFTPPADGTYYVEVFSKTTARNVYDLLLYEDIAGTPDVIDDGDDGPADRACPDAFEDNDSRAAQASEIPSGNYERLLICGGDRDYYSVFVPSGATLEVDLFFAHADNNIDVQVFRGSSTSAVGSGLTSTDNESVSVTNNDVAETYVIDVFGRAQADAFYDMDIALTFANACAEDSFGTATTPNFGPADAASVTAGSYDLQLCETTEDWFEFTLAAGESVQARIELQNRLGNIDLELYDSTGIVDNSSTDGNIEEIDYMSAAGGTYQLRVFPRGGVFLRNAYDLWLAIAGTQPAAPFCPDPFERNDDASSATPLDWSAQPQRTELIMCGVEQDWYAVDLVGGQTYDWKLYYEYSADSDLAVEVRDSAGNLIQDGAGVDISFANDADISDAMVSFTAPTSGVYSLGVEQQGSNPSVAAFYPMIFKAASAACQEDASEPNNDFTAPSPIQSGFNALASCQANGNKNDFFSFEATQDGTVLVGIAYDEAQLTGLAGRVDGAVMDATATNRQFLNVPVTAGQVIEISVGNFSSTEEGEYFLYIFES